MKKKTLSARYDLETLKARLRNLQSVSQSVYALPKWVKVIPYVAGSGAAVAVINYLELLEVNDTVLMAIINLLIVFLKDKVKK